MVVEVASKDVVDVMTEEGEGGGVEGEEGVFVRNYIVHQTPSVFEQHQVRDSAKVLDFLDLRD